MISLSPRPWHLHGVLAAVAWACMVGNIPAAGEGNPVGEAKLRSQLLHEMVHGALQVMHRDFFNEEEKSKIPSESLEDVFGEMEKTWGVKIEWLAVDTKAMNVDHRADDAFERKAVEVISAGADSHDMKDGPVYRYAGVIPLGNRCLKCHVPDRTNLEERKAAVVISMPLQLVRQTP